MTDLYENMSERALISMRKIMWDHKDSTIKRICYVVEPGSKEDIDERRTLELTETAIDTLNDAIVKRIKF